MDLLTFISEVLKSTAWPAAAVILALLFRKEIKVLLLRLRKGKFGSAELDFEEGMREVRNELPPNLPSPRTSQNEFRMLLAAAHNKRSTVLESWLKLESAVNGLAMKRNLVNALMLPTAQDSATALAQAGVIEPWMLNAVRDLRRLRNEAAHQVDFTPSDASVTAFVSTVAQLLSAISALEDAA